MNERGRGSLVYQREVVGEEPDGGGGGCCRCRRSGARASELRLQKGPPGDGDHSCELEEARGGVELLESCRTVAVFERNLSAWGRTWGRRQRGNGEDAGAIKWA